MVFAFMITPILGQTTCVEIRLFRGNFTIADLSAYYIDNLRFLLVPGHMLTAGINAMGLGVVMPLNAIRHIFGIDWPQSTCAWCGTFLPRSCQQKCSRCTLARYCNKHCQTQHWYAGHQFECPQLGDAYRSARRTLHVSHLPVGCGFLSEYDYMLFCHLARSHANPA